MNHLIALVMGLALMTPTERFVRAAFDAGCPRDQVENFLRAGLVFTPQQLKAAAACRLCDLPDGPTEVGYGGARGGGKSHFSIGQLAADDCQRFPGLKVLYLRKVGKAGREAVQDLRRSVLHSIPHEYRVSENKILFPNGSVIILGHFQSDKDIDNYLGLEYDVALIEEATQLTEQKISDISTCVRTSKPGWRPRMYYTTNPGNVGHDWFKKKFIKPLRNKVETTTRFIQATVHDNPFVDAGYRAKLEKQRGWKRQAWLYGSWDIAAGQYFTNFRNELIVQDLGELPEDWRVWLGFDYGYQHYTAVYLFAADSDGVVYIYDEHAERNMQPVHHAAKIKEMLARHGVRLSDLDGIMAGGDCFNTLFMGTSIADAYAEFGIILERADNDRPNGAAEFLRRFGDPDSTPPIPPTLFIDRRCERLIECIPALQVNLKRPEDVKKVDSDEDGNGGDDSYDAARYGLMHAVDRRAVAGPNPLGRL